MTIIKFKDSIGYNKSQCDIVKKFFLIVAFHVLIVSQQPDISEI